MVSTAIGNTESVSIIVSMPSTVVAASMASVKSTASTMGVGKATSKVNTLTGISMPSAANAPTGPRRGGMQGLVNAVKQGGTVSHGVRGPRLPSVMTDRNRGVSGMLVAGLRSTVPRDQKADHRMGLAWGVDPVPAVRRR